MNEIHCHRHHHPHHENFPCHPHPTYFQSVPCPLPSVLVQVLHCYDAGCSQLIRKGQGEREPASSSSQRKILWKVTYLLCLDIAWQLEEVFNVYFPRRIFSTLSTTFQFCTPFKTTLEIASNYGTL